MHLVPRTPLHLLIVLVLVPLALVANGCSTGDDPGGADSGPTVVATGPGTPTGSADTTATSSPTQSASAGLPDSAAAVCAAYAAMVDAVKDAATSSADPDEVAAEIGPVLKQFAAQVPDLDRPEGISAATWQGVQALARRITELPDHPTRDQIEAVEDDLSAQEQDAVKAAAGWLRTTCGG